MAKKKVSDFAEEKIDRSKWGPLEKAREALDDIWKECGKKGFRGRCWGGIESVIPRSNIILSDAEVVVIVHSYGGDRYSNVCLVVIGNSTESTLEERVRQTLVAAGLLFNLFPSLD